jgi:hypothetical protein
MTFLGLNLTIGNSVLFYLKTFWLAIGFDLQKQLLFSSLHKNILGFGLVKQVLFDIFWLTLFD